MLRMIRTYSGAGRRIRSLLVGTLTAGMLVGLTTCGGSSGDRVLIDLSDIKERGALRAITTYSSTSYFIYRGQPMGFEFELLRRLADYLELDLEIIVADDLDRLFDMLHNGDGDIIAHNLTVTKKRTEEVAFTLPHMTTQQVLVQRKPDKWRKMKLHEINDSLIRSPIELIGKTIHVRRNSSYYERLQNLSEEIGGEINIVPVEGNLSTEQLIWKVADGEIEYTVADENIAFINKTYHSILDVKMRISLPQQIAWAVRRSSPELLSAVNDWLKAIKQNPDYYTIYNKYFRNRKLARRRISSEYFTITGDKISPYDSLLRIHGDEIDWDWRLLASLMYRESQFDSTAESWAGAEGLMQMMPATAAQFGVTDLTDPHQSLDAAAAYLSYLQTLYDDVPDTLERIKFVLASYNVGENHVSDARRLAEKNGADPMVWSGSVEEYMKLLSNPEYYRDKLVEYGYARGEEPVEYVRDVLDLYYHYRRLVDFRPQPEPDSAAG